MKSLKMVLLLVVSLGMLAYGCAKSDDSDGSTSSTSAYSRKNLPAKSSNNLPSTLTSKASAGRTAAAAISQSMGANQAQSAVMMMKYMLTNVELNMILMDAAIEQGVMAAGNCYEKGNVKISFTSDMLEALKEVFKKVDSEMSAGELSTYTNMVGQQMGNDQMAVSLVSTTKRDFSKILTLGTTNSTCSGTSVSAIDEVMMWSDNGNKLQYTFDYSDSSGTNFGSLTYDGATKTSSFDMYFKQTGFDGLFSGNFTECNSGTDDCVRFRVTMGDTSFKVETRGKADNNGGYGISRFMSSSFNIFIKEHWNTELKSAKYVTSDSCPATWDNESDCSYSNDLLQLYSETSSTTGLTSYETDAGKVFSQNWKGTPAQTSAYLADSAGQKYVLMADSSTTDVSDIIGIAVKLDNSTAGFTLYFDPSNNDNLTMRDLSINSSDNTRSIGSSVASGLVMTY